MCFRLDPDDTAEADSERLILAPPPEFRVCRHAHFVWPWHLIQDLVNAMPGKHYQWSYVPSPRELLS